MRARAGEIRVLAVTNMFPSERDRSQGTFVKTQLESLAGVGVSVSILFCDRAREGVQAYRTLRARLAAAIESFRPDLVHAMYGGVLASTAACSIGTLPLIVSYCGSDLLGGAAPSLLKRAMARWGVHASHRAARRASAAIVKTEELRQALGKDAPRATYVIPNGVDLTMFRPADRSLSRRELGWAEDSRHILFAGRRHIPEKRYSLARAAFEVFAREGSPAVLHSLDSVPHSEVPSLLNASDALLLTSQHEGSPNIVKEALACGRPVVSVDVGDVRQRLHGLPGCSTVLAERLLLAGGLRAALAASAQSSAAIAVRRDSVSNLSLENTASQVVAVYESVLGNRLTRTDARKEAYV